MKTNPPTLSINDIACTSPTLRPHKSKTLDAFTRLELLVLSITILILASVLFPLMANSKLRSEQAGCVNNLRLIGRAYHLWGNDHNDLNPFRTYDLDGGMIPASGTAIGAAWIFYAFIQNELSTPKILVCPADTRLIAKDFSNSADGGLFNVHYQNQAVTYFVGLHAFPDEPFSFLGGDRNMQVSRVLDRCIQGIDTAARLSINTSTPQWTNGLHYSTGNILFNSGAVQELSTQGLQDAINMHTNSIMDYIHLLLP